LALRIQVLLACCIEESAVVIAALHKVEKAEGQGMAVLLGKLVKCRRDCKRAVVVEWAAREIQACKATSPDDIKGFGCEVAKKMKEKGVYDKGSDASLSKHCT
jgi:hypothetical protein